MGMRFDFITIFPSMIQRYCGESILGRGQKSRLIEMHTHNPRQFTTDHYHSIDDAPYGGGPGMIMMIAPLVKTLDAIPRKGKSRIILLSAKGIPLTQSLVKKFATHDQLIFICGRYEGVDERMTNFIDHEISVGPYVVTGGELPALIIADATSRLIPGIVGNSESVSDESYSLSPCREYPQYTRPKIFQWRKKKYPVPGVLLSGHHKKIQEWKDQHRKK